MDSQHNVQQLRSVMALASVFSTCVEAFGLVHPSKVMDRRQCLALTRLGIEQGRLLIFGSIVGISSPPSMIATHMVPSHADDTNPDPTSPIYFDPRDSRLDEDGPRKLVEDTLNEIVDRPSHLSREEMMETYGLQPPRRLLHTGHPALDTTRLEAFYEKYDLLEDLIDSLGGAPQLRRSKSITAHHWQIHNVVKFSAFVKMVRESIDKLADAFECRDRIDRCIKTDIRSIAWHPSAPMSLMRKDLDKLQLIMEVCQEDYPAFVPVTQLALDYLGQEMNDAQGAWPVTIPGSAETKSAPAVQNSTPVLLGKEREKNPNKDIGLSLITTFAVPDVIPEMGDLAFSSLNLSCPDSYPFPATTAGAAVSV